MFNDIVSFLQSKFSDIEPTVAEIGTSFIKVPGKDLVNICQSLKDSQFELHTLQVVSGVDYPPEKIEVSYILASYTKNLELMLKVDLNRENPSVPSVVSVWNAANFQERECFDMVGVNFEGHPDHRRILCPEDWEGYPLRKDYQVQEVYNGMVVNPEHKMNIPERTFAQKQKEAEKAKKAAESEQ